MRFFSRKSASPLDKIRCPLSGKALKDIATHIDDGDEQLAIRLPYPPALVEAELREALGPVLKGRELVLSGSLPRYGEGLGNVKNIIAVASGKGGVGKSTTSINLALALKALGLKVGVLDADLFGPSLPIMVGKKGERPESPDGKVMYPIQAHGLYTQSLGYLVEADNAAVWRGPMASTALLQLINETRWPELDVLIVDMPPGTGDIQLTLSQKVPLTGAVIVTTPQDLALADAIKGISMFDKVSVPVLGLVENMSFHICSNCGHHEAIFGEEGGKALAQQKGLALLGQIPLHMAIRAQTDGGNPTVVAEPQGEHARAYLAAARSLIGQLVQRPVPAQRIGVQIVEP
ncbi:iron-sulfur cluster carrier protein ApbC [Gallaecimonas sp. GXIMD4217]|uniref:iron-sulfur cluster carrier protein ApbC n=1 Tax=Gallaecimonas sp. GXIMD4217 TaxID=3131927 RepID=UPI00311B3633